MKQAVARVFVLRCSEQCQAVVERFLDEQRRVRARIESQVAEVLKKGRLEEACRMVAAFEASQVFPRDPTSTGNITIPIKTWPSYERLRTAARRSLAGLAVSS
jgi:hypothetical protein